VHPQSPALRELAEKWKDVPPAERANAQPFVIELCDALGVERPRPRGSGYEFEFPVSTTDRKTGKTTTNFIDLYRQGHFIVEAKHTGAGTDREMGAAYGQAKGYAGDIPHAPPPYLMVLNVGRTLLVWDRWGGNFGGVNAARRIDLRTLWQRDDDIEFLRAVWEHPESLNPAVRGRVVTREVAERLAKLSASLEGRGVDGERVARFLMRCVFTMFAEDVGLLQEKLFQGIIQDFRNDPGEFRLAMEELWQKMDRGDRFGGKRLLRFNGHFFHEAEALELTTADLAVLADAAAADWRQVEPTIFGTLLTRALDPKERHRLGAEYTPREYVERVVRQTVDVPLRERWAPVQAHAAELAASKRKKDRDAALGELREFHRWLRGLRFLDPACGSGNFLYVALHMVKRLELEVLRAIEEITGNPELGLDEVGPGQFHGIEIKPWAREIAELTLWIGYHQFWMEHHKGGKVPEPVLEDTGTLELRDAVLAWDEIVEVPEKSRPDPTPRIAHPVTGKLVPDPQARLPYYEYRGARPAEWPQADFIVGNPPYLGSARMRTVFGDGYVEALRKAYLSVPDTADYVMYWWYRAAGEVASGRVLYAGLITTNTITQTQNRGIVATAAREGAHVVWAVADHPWVDEGGGADVRVALTVIGRGALSATLAKVDESGAILSEEKVSYLNPDLTRSVDVARAASVPISDNRILSYRGVSLLGQGFVLTQRETEELIKLDPTSRSILRRFVNGRDLTDKPRNLYVIDFALSDENTLREYPVIANLLHDRVKPERDANKRTTYSKFWWRFGEPRSGLRAALAGLERYIATPMTAKHRFFTFLDIEILPDQGLIAIASSDAHHLGVLSSAIHVVWSLAAGGTLEDRPRYNNSRCFDSFPFPDPPRELRELREEIGRVAERLDRHRKDAIARDERVTMTGMYNVVEKLRSGEKLTDKERVVHEIAACGVLKDIHDELDRLVAQAYGWPWPMEREEVLERLVALHDERVEEEKRGIVRWLRPEYQIPRFGGAAPAAAEPALDLPDEPAAEAAPADEARPWPAGAIEQIGAVKARVTASAATPAEVAATFAGASVPLITRELEMLAMVGEVRALGDGRYEAVTEPL
jgi:hypothetical protein